LIAASALFANGVRRTPPPTRVVACEGLLRQYQHGKRCVGGYGLQVGRQRGVHGEKRLCQPRPSEEAEGRIMPKAMHRANNAKSKIRSRTEHVSAEQKERMDLFIRTIGIARATTKIGLANFICNIKRLLFLRRIAAA
jgi:hypothetical protein